MGNFVFGQWPVPAQTENPIVPMIQFPVCVVGMPFLFNMSVPASDSGGSIFWSRRWYGFIFADRFFYGIFTLSQSWLN